MVPFCTHTPVHDPRCCTPPWAVVVVGFWATGASYSLVGGTPHGFGGGFGGCCDLACRWLVGRVVAQVDEGGCEVRPVPVRPPFGLLRWLMGAKVSAGVGMAYPLVIAAAAAPCTHQNKHTLVSKLKLEAAKWLSQKFAFR